MLRYYCEGFGYNIATGNSVIKFVKSITNVALVIKRVIFIKWMDFVQIACFYDMLKSNLENVLMTLCISLPLE